MCQTQLLTDSITDIHTWQVRVSYAVSQIQKMNGEGCDRVQTRLLPSHHDSHSVCITVSQSMHHDEREGYILWRVLVIARHGDTFSLSCCDKFPSRTQRNGCQMNSRCCRQQATVGLIHQLHFSRITFRASETILHHRTRTLGRGDRRCCCFRRRPRLRRRRHAVALMDCGRRVRMRDKAA